MSKRLVIKNENEYIKRPNQWPAFCLPAEQRFQLQQAKRQSWRKGGCTKYKAYARRNSEPQGTEHWEEGAWVAKPTSVVNLGSESLALTGTLGLTCSNETQDVERPD